VTWQPGRDKIAELLDAGELEQVTADQRIAQLLHDDAGRHLATAATALSSGDLSGAYQLAYDALRKSAASLLAVQGLRATSRGGHIAIQDAIGAQFGASVPVFRSFARIDAPATPSNTPAALTHRDPPPTSPAPSRPPPSARRRREDLAAERAHTLVTHREQSSVTSSKERRSILWSDLCASTTSFLSACRLVVDPFSGARSLT